MKKYLILLAAILICYFAGSQIIRPNPTTNFQQFGTPVTYTRINGLLYPAVGYAPALYADTAAMNATYLKNVPLAHAATSDGKWWVRSYDVQKWLQVYISGISSPGIDDVLAVGQSLTTNKSINNGGYNLSFYSATNKLAARIDSLQRFQVNKISALTDTLSSYEIIVLPDLQHMTTTYPSVLRTITDWIVANKSGNNIKAVISVGDLTQNYGVNAEFDTIRANFNTMHNAGIPVFPVIGNHDYNNIASRVDTTWQNYFGPSYFSDKPYYVSSKNGNTANYFINIDIADRKYTFIALEFFPSDDAIYWADSVINTIPDRRIIICTHAYIDEKGQRTLDNSLYGVNTYFSTESANNGQELWEKLISKYQNIEFIFSGHHIEGLSFTHLTDVGKNGNIVNQIYYNRQGDANGGNGYFMRLKFHADSSNVRINAYSNYLASYDNLVPEFVLDYPAIQINATVGVKNLHSCGELRVDSTVYFQNIPLYSIPFAGYMGQLKSNSNFTYNYITNSLSSPNAYLPTSLVVGNTSLVSGSVGTMKGNLHLTDTSKLSFNSIGNEYIFSRKTGNISSSVRGNFEWFSDVNLNNGSYNMDYRWFTNTHSGLADITAPKMALTNDGALSVGAGINDIASSAILELRSTNRGFLPPRLTTAQMNAISSPGTGLLVWNIDSLNLVGYNGTAWRTNGGSGIPPSSLTIGTTTIGNSLSGSVLYDSSGILSRNDEFYWDRTNKRLGIGTASPSAKLHSLATTEQLRLGYDGSNYFSTTVGSSGGVTFDAIGSGSRFTYSDGVTLPAGSATATVGSPLKFTTGTNLTTAEAGAMEYATPQLFFTNGAALRQELFQGNQNFVQTQFDKTSSTTLGDVTNLSVNVAAGKAYRFQAELYTSSNVAGGVKAAISGTATATTIIYEGLTTDAGLTTQGRATSLGTAVGAVTAVTAAYIKITGTIIVNAAGTLTVQFAQNASNGSASSVLVGSTFHVIEMAYFP